MTTHHPKLNLKKTELPLMPWKDCPYKDLLVIVENIAVSESPTARNLGVVLDNLLCCTANMAPSCRYSLYNIRRIQPFLKGGAAYLVVLALFLSLACSVPCVQPTSTLPCDLPLQGPPLAPCRSSYQIQDDGTGIRGGQWD